MTINILYDWQLGPWGGGNQFLQALRRELRRQRSYAEEITEAQAVLLNLNPGSFRLIVQHLPRLLRLKIPVIARIDGPISLMRGQQKYLDRIIWLITKIAAQGIIWQSHWSRQRNRELIGIHSPQERVIHNAPDTAIFYPDSSESKPRHPLRLIATSWSANPRKGFDVYQYLEQQLDPTKFTMTFIGNTPIEFKHINHLPPLSSDELSHTLRQQDIYITASQNDPCSNALLEALACGLPAVALHSGGHPELIGEGGKLFTGTGDVLSSIEEVAANYEHYGAHLPRLDITSVAQEYLQFARDIRT